MSRRYYLIIFVVLFAVAVWGLITTFEGNSAPSAASIKADNATLAPQSAQQ